MKHSPNKQRTAMKALKKKNSNHQNNNLVADCPNGELAHDQIALAAYSIWEQEGRPQGREVDHWLRAENLLRQAGKQAALRA